MMKNAKLLMAAFCAVLAAAPLTSRADDKETRNAMTSIFKKAVEQFKKKDLDGFMSMYHPDFSAKSANGQTMNFQSFRAEMESAMNATKSVRHASLKIEKLRLLGYTAEVTSVMKFKAKVVDKEGVWGKPGAVRELATEERAKETWVRYSGGWKCKFSQALPGGKSTVDGKPIDPAEVGRSETPAKTARATRTKS